MYILFEEKRQTLLSANWKGMSGNLYSDAYQILSSIFVLRPQNEHSESFFVKGF